MLNIQPNTRLNKYVVIDEINSIGKNSVFKAYIPSSEEESFNNSTKYYIIKAIPYETEAEKEVYDNESNILNMLNNISTIINYVETFAMKNKITGGKQYIFAVMNFYSNTDLYEFYINHINDKVDTDQVRLIAYQALTILNSIHKKNIVHHDVKLGNFLIESLSPLCIKITDFEFSVKLDENGLTNQPYGTFFYMAPELLNCMPHGKSVDIWALGIMLYELTAKKMPFNIKENQSQRAIVKMKVCKTPLSFDDNFQDPIFKDLLFKMLEKKTSNRITAEDALNHPYFQCIRLDH